MRREILLLGTRAGLLGRASAWEKAVKEEKRMKIKGLKIKVKNKKKKISNIPSEINVDLYLV